MADIDLVDIDADDLDSLRQLERRRKILGLAEPTVAREAPNPIMDFAQRRIFGLPEMIDSGPVSGPSDGNPMLDAFRNLVGDGTNGGRPLPSRGVSRIGRIGSGGGLPAPERPTASDADPFAGLEGVPRFLRDVGDVAGPGLAEAAENVPGVGGALNVLSFLDSTFIQTPVGAVALGSDALVQTGLRDVVARRMQREGRPLWEVGKVAAEELDIAMQKIAEDQGEEGAARFLAQLSRGVRLGGELVAPIAPGSAFVRGPVAGAARSGAGAVRSVTGRLPGRAVPRVDAEQLATRVGATTPAQRSVADDLARQVAEREARAETLPVEPELQRAVVAQERRMGRLVVRVAEGRATAEEADELARFLEARGAPAQVLDPIRRTADAALETQARLSGEAEAAARAAREADIAQRAQLRAVEREARKAGTRERRTQDAVQRAEDALHKREERLLTVEQEEAARLAKKAEAQRIVRESVPADEIAAEARIPKALDQQFAAMDRRLAAAAPDAAGTATPAKFAQALRAEAKRARAQIQRLPKRGLQGERIPDRGGLQTARQEQFGSGLVQGRVQFRPTGDRISLETQAGELEELARRIDVELGTIRGARRFVIDERHKLAAGSDEERYLLRTSRAYRDFLGVGELDEAGLQAAQRTIDEASSRIAEVIRDARDRGIKPPQAEKAEALVREMRSDVEALRESILRTLGGGEPETVRLRQSVLGFEDAEAADDVAAARARLDEAELTTSTLRVGDAPIHADLGYASPRDEALLSEFGINTGKWSSPTSRKMLAETVRENADEFRARRARISNDELLNEVAPRVAGKIGMDEKAFRELLPKRGELSGLLVVVDAALDRSARAIARAGRELQDGRITQEAFDELYGRHVSLQLDISEGGSEVARAQASRRIVRETGVAEALAAKRRVEAAEKDMRGAESEMDRAADELTKAEQRADADAAKADATTDSAIAGGIRLDSSKRVQAARDAVARARGKVDEAVAAHRAAVETAAEASERYHAASVVRAIRSGMDKDRVTVLAQLDPANVLSVHDFLRNQHKLSKPEWVISWALSNSYGSVISLQNNFINTGLRVLHRNFVIRPASLVTGKVAERALGQPVVVPAEITQAWIGMFGATGDAFQFMARQLLFGEASEIALKYRLVGITEESAQKFGISSRPLARGPKGLLVESAYRFLSAGDGFWRVLDSAAETRSLIARDGWLKGLRGDELGRYVAEKVRDPDPKLLDRSAVVSLKSTFNNPVDVGSPTQKALRLINHRFGGNTPFLRLLFPAARFGIAAAKHMANLSGFGIVKSGLLVRRIHTLPPGQAVDVAREAAASAAEGVLGVAMILVANEMYEQDLLTGDAPRNAAERRIWEKTKRPSSVLVNGQWVPLGQLGPLAAPFVFTAAVRDAITEGESMDDDRIQRMVTRGAGAIGQVFADMPAIDGTYRLVRAVYSLTEGGTAAEREFSTLASRFLPFSGTLRSLVPVWDPDERDPEGIIERLQGRVPGLSQEVPARLDQFGRVVQRPLSGVEALGPTQGVTPGRLDPVEAEMQARGFTVGFVGDSIGGQKLAREEERTYLEAAGTRAYANLFALVRSPEYLGASDDKERRRLWDRAVDEARRLARRIVADDAMHASTTDEEIARASRMQLSQMTGASLGDEAEFFARLDFQGKLTPPAKAALDRERGFARDGERKPTVDQYLRAAELVEEFEQLPSYRIGTPDEWRRLREAKRRMEGYIEANPPPPGWTQLDWYTRANRTDALLIRRYAPAALHSPARERFLAQHPGIKRFLEVTVPVQVIPSNP